ncbi:hypothetical protein DL98DRAFT_509125, partial [Cadophora sp. DSE1049]
MSFSIKAFAEVSSPLRTLLALYLASLSGAMMQMMCFWGVYPWDHIMGVDDDWM